MLKKFRVLLVIIALVITLSLMNNTYSRYVAGSSSDVKIDFAKWQLLVNETDITNQSSSNITFEPVIYPNTNVAKNKIAPSSSGYFDIEIDPTNVDVSFKYTINLAIDESQNIPDLIITKYAFIPENYIENDDEENKLNYVYLDNTSVITNEVSYSAEGFKPITIRIFFEWYEGENEAMNDTADTNVGLEAATNDTKFTINAQINFEQVIA